MSKVTIINLINKIERNDNILWTAAEGSFMPCFFLASSHRLIHLLCVTKASVTNAITNDFQTMEKQGDSYKIIVRTNLCDRSLGQGIQWLHTRLLGYGMMQKFFHLTNMVDITIKK